LHHLQRTGLIQICSKNEQNNTDKHNVLTFDKKHLPPTKPTFCYTFEWRVLCVVDLISKSQNYSNT